MRLRFRKLRKNHGTRRAFLHERLHSWRQGRATCDAIAGNGSSKMQMGAGCMHESAAKTAPLIRWCNPQSFNLHASTQKRVLRRSCLTGWSVWHMDAQRRRDAPPYTLGLVDQSPKITATPSQSIVFILCADACRSWMHALQQTKNSLQQTSWLVSILSESKTKKPRIVLNRLISHVPRQQNAA